MTDDIFVIGAGPAGLTAAYLLTKAGVGTTVIEADPQYVGGISRTENYKGYLFDIGGHRFFSKSKEVVDLWNEILPRDFIERPRLSRIYYNGKFAPAAGALGYSGGLMIHYVFSAFWVFPDPMGRRRTRVTLLKFVATGLLGLVLTSGLIGTLTGARLCGPYAAKLVAIAVSTVTVFVVRRAYVFVA
jgi:putative flippase GtrA